MTSLADRIDDLLPQTQCTRCGYDGCAPYAAAIWRGEAAINRCPPGGYATITALAALTAQPHTPLDAHCGSEAPLRVAVIDEPRCIGCTLCIAACPVDAIIGAAKRMHVVLPSLCSGCELCVAPCPVDCIDLVPAGREWSAKDAAAARARHRGRATRIAGVPAQPIARTDAAREERERAVAAAVACARGRRNGVPA